MKTLTKANIETMAKEIMAFLEENGARDAVSIYYNNKVVRSKMQYDVMGEYYIWKEEEDVDPHDYFEYAAYDHILSMSFEGTLYDDMNYGAGRLTDKLRAIFEKYGVYFELGNAWNLSAYPIDDDMVIEYTKYKKPKQTIYLYHHRYYMNPPELQAIMDKWYDLSAETGDKGSCVLGAGFHFEWKGDEYFMCACSPWQGSLSWEAHEKTIKFMLEDLGATGIWYDCGRMD